MIRRAQFLCFIIIAACGAAGCNQSTPPAVVAAPVQPEPVSTPAQPPETKDKPAQSSVPFSFPDDRGGKALAKMLTPTNTTPMPASVPPTQKPRRLPSFLDSPAPASIEVINSPPRLALPATRPAQPMPMPDRVPTELGGLLPQLPHRTDWPTGALTRSESQNANSPELPLLSPRPVADRAPLTDPTIEFTAQSVISTKLPIRTEPTGFLRINLPDPFEHVEGAKPRTPVLENPNRSLGNPPPPK